MLRDLGNEVVVRLYRPEGPAIGRTGYTPVHLRILKSVVTNKGADMYARGSLWVQMVEKAYASLNFGEEGPRSSTPAFTDIHKGKATVAFEVLLGRPSREREISSHRDLVPRRGTALPWSLENRLIYNDVKGRSASFEPIPAYADIFGRSDEKLHAWMALVETETVEDMLRSKLNTGKAVRHEDFEALFKARKLREDVAGAVLTWLDANRIVPHKRGTGRYTPEQDEVFADIAAALDARKEVTVSSNEQIGTSPTPPERGHSADEAQVKGLVSEHAYTVLDYDDESPPVKRVQLRNPWGRYGRRYEPSAAKGHKAQADEGGDGRFWIDLSDLTKRFSRIRGTA
jgi:hypothetical protein